MIYKSKWNTFKVRLFEKIMKILGITNVYAKAMTEAIETIESLQRDVKKLDQKIAIDVRSMLSIVDFDKLGDIVWVKVSDERLLRYDTFNQVRDYMKSHGKEHSILILTKNDVELKSLTDADLLEHGLRRLTLRERQ